MKLNKRYKLHEASSRDIGRYSMQHVSLDDGNLVALDDHILAVVPVEIEEGDTDGLIPREALIDACKAPSKNGGIASIEANGSIIVRSTPESMSTYQRPEGPFPTWRQVVPSSSGFKVAFNPELFARLVKAIGSHDSVTLTFTDGEAPECHPIHVQGEGEAYGIIMPVRVDR